MALLICRCPKVTTKFAPILSQFQGLTSINLAYNRFINGKIADCLANLLHLRSLKLMNCEMMSDENVIHLGRLTQLNRLDLSGNVVSSWQRLIRARYVMFQSLETNSLETKENTAPAGSLLLFQCSPDQASVNISMKTVDSEK